MAKQATEVALKNLRPTAARRLVLYDGGLGVRVSPNGRKTWVYWFRMAGQKRLMTLGEYPHMSVKEAIAAHSNARAQRANGTDPAELKVAERRAARTAAKAPPHDAQTVRWAFDKWKALELKLRHKDKGDAMEAEFARHVFPSLGTWPMSRVGKGDVMEIVDRLRGTGKTTTAKAVLSHLKQFFDFALDRDYIDKSPAQTLKPGRVVGKLHHRDRVLADWEVARLLARLPLVDLSPVTVLALRFILATGQRPGEVAGMPKSELDSKRQLWTIPPQRYKEETMHDVPLSGYARSVLADADAYNHSSPYVFPSPQSLGRPIERHSLSRAVLRKLGTATLTESEPADGELGLAPFVPHDLRRTARTGLAALGVPEHIGERVLGHKLQGMMAVYNHHRYLDERRDALQRWGDKLAAI